MTTVTVMLDLVARVSLLFGAAALLAWLLRRGPAAARHLVWTVAIAGSLALPVLSLVAPRWEVAMLPKVTTCDARGARCDVPDAPRATAEAPRAMTDVPRAMTDVPRATPPSETSASGLGPLALTDVPSFAATVWSLGFLAVLLRLALGTVRMWWIARRARPLSSGRWLRLAESLAGSLGVRHRVIFLEGARGAMPMTWGVLRPRVLLPEAASEWPVSRQRVVLLHELAHVKRRDCLTQFLAQAACALYWFNPLAWFAARRLRAERERACDDVVLASGTRGSDYADHLLEIARSMRTVALPTWAAVAMAHRSQLEGRLMAILDTETPRRIPTRRRSMALASTLAALAIPIAILTPVPKAAEAVVTTIDPGHIDRPTFPEPAVTPAAVPAPAPAPEPAIKGGQANVEGTTGKEQAAALAKAAVKATLSSEWLGPIVEGALQGLGEGVAEGVREGIGEAIGEGLAQAPAQGVRGGVAGGVQGGVGEERASRRDPRAVAALVEALKDSDREVREHAMQALANMRAPEALDAIRAALKDENASVREQAAFALGQYRDKPSVDALAAALKDSSADVREQAAFALGQIRSTQAVEPLGAALKDASADVREQAAFALGQIRDRRAVDALLGGLRDESASVREQAAFALGQIRDPRAVDGLTAALKDASVEVRRQAAYALGQIGR